MTPTPKYPHSVGPTRLSYSSDGRYLFTTGANALVRRFVTGSAREPDTLELEAPGLAIAASTRHFAVGVDDGTVLLYALEDSKPLSTPVRAPLPVRSVSFSDDGTWLAAAGDSGVAIVNVDDQTIVRSLPQQPKPPRYVSFRPRAAGSSAVAVSAMDGSLRVYQFEDTTGNLVYTISDILPFVGDSADSRSTAGVWSPDGQLLALPTKSFDIALFNAEDGSPEFRLHGAKDAITDISFSSNGVYLAATTRNGCVLVWALSSREIVHREDELPELGHIRWHPNQNTMAWTSQKGQLYVAQDSALPASLAASFGEVVELPQSSRKRRALEREIEDLHAEAHEDSDDSGFLDEEEMWGTERPAIASRLEPLTAATQIRQKTFQPGSTPWIDSRRFLTINTTGSVWSQLQDESHNSITISFFDNTENRDIHFRDSNKLDLASLSNTACLFASTKSNQAMMRFHQSAIDNWDWTAPANDGIVAVALAESACLIYTKNGLVYTFSLYGTPVEVSQHGNDLITVATCGNIVATIKQLYQTKVLSMVDASQQRTLLMNFPLEVKQVTNLLFSESGCPIVVDSSNQLAVLDRWRAGQEYCRWVPITVGAASQKPHWPLALLDSEYLCIELRSMSEKYPSCPLPAPSSFELPLSIPGISEVEASTLLARSTLLQQHDYYESIGALESEEVTETFMELSLAVDKLLLRQLTAAISQNKFSKCLEIAAKISTPDAQEAAAAIAAKFDQTTLAAKILELFSTETEL